MGAALDLLLEMAALRCSSSSHGLGLGLSVAPCSYTLAQSIIPLLDVLSLSLGSSLPSLTNQVLSFPARRITLEASITLTCPCRCLSRQAALWVFPRQVPWVQPFFHQGVLLGPGRCLWALLRRVCTCSCSLLPLLLGSPRPTERVVKIPQA